ncbi:MAG: phenylalanine--tRNA ligase subunit beta [bacterium]
MNISHQWLRELTDVSWKPAELAERLSMLGLEIAHYEDLGEKYKLFVVGQVMEVKKHPNADRLTVCSVNIGSKELGIICGAPNVEAGQKVAVGLVGAVIPQNQHDAEGKPFILQRAKIRGVESNGMICSGYELGLNNDAERILVLDLEAKVGTPLADHLGANDVVYEIDVTANRGDWLSHIGVAREIAAITGKKAQLPKVALKEIKTLTSTIATIRIEDAIKCPRYSSRVLHNITVGQSPKWLQDRLTAIGIRPINNVVDVTNYIMMETGQPLHAFDYDTLSLHTIVVKCAREGEKFVTLDGKERILTDDILMICDGEREIAIAGVMGGANTEITNKTTNVLIESACFEPGSVRRASKFLGLSTDASQRFERGTDCSMTLYAANRVAQLLQEISGVEVFKGSIDVYPKKKTMPKVLLRVPRVNAVLGTSISKSTVVKFLRQLGVTLVSQKGDRLTFVPPTHRNDLLEEIDLIEEVARLYGYDRIETKTRTQVDFSTPLKLDTFQDQIRDYLIGAGFNEIYSLSLHDKESAALADDRAIEMLNPKSTEASVLRTCMSIGGLKTVKHNQSFGQKDLKIFEFGHVFSLIDETQEEILEGYHEEERLLLLLTGRKSPAQFGSDARPVTLLDLKGELESVLTKFFLDKYRFISYDSRRALIEFGLAVEINSTYAGFLGKIAKPVLERMDIEGDVYVAELKLAILENNKHKSSKYQPLPKFPKVIRDLAFVVDYRLEQGEVEKCIRHVGGPLLSNVVLFDIYEGDQAGKGKKSLAYTLEFQPIERTLTDKEIETFIAAIVQDVTANCNAQLRS